VWRANAVIRPSPTLARWIPVVIWMAIIFALSAQSSFPRGPEPMLEVLLRKIAHLSEYAVLAILVARALGGAAIPTLVLVFRTMAIVLVYAISDEIHQSFVPSRMPSPTDVIIDMIGALIGLGIFRAWEATRGQRV
jgi:VanZ family protein